MKHLLIKYTVNFYDGHGSPEEGQLHKILIKCSDEFHAFLQRNSTKAFNSSYIENILIEREKFIIECGDGINNNLDEILCDYDNDLITDPDNFHESDGYSCKAVIINSITEISDIHYANLAQIINSYNKI